MGLGVLFQCLRPYFPLPKGWFPFSLKGRWPMVGWCRSNSGTPPVDPSFAPASHQLHPSHPSFSTG